MIQSQATLCMALHRMYIHRIYIIFVFFFEYANTKTSVKENVIYISDNDRDGSHVLEKAVWKRHCISGASENGCFFEMGFGKCVRKSYIPGQRFATRPWNYCCIVGTFSIRSHQTDWPFATWMWARLIARQIMSLHSAWRCCRKVLRLQNKPCKLLASTHFSHAQVRGLQVHTQSQFEANSNMYPFVAPLQSNWCYRRSHKSVAWMRR